jgi:hypothetical protein
MLTQLPQITVNGDCRLGDLWQMIIRIDLGRNVQSIDEEIDLRNLEANCFQIKIELQFRENLELLAKHPLISSWVLSQAVVGDQESSALWLGEMTQPNSWHRLPPKTASGLQSTMARYYHLLVIDQEWDVKSKRLDTLCYLANLFIAMYSRVSWVGLQGCNSDVGHF